MLSEIKHISKGGYQQLYRGLPVSLVLTVPALSVYLATYDMTKDFLTSATSMHKQSAQTFLVAAVVAEVLSGLFWTPMEVLKIRQQASTMPYTAANTSPTTSCPSPTSKNLSCSC
jgi:solute carrier family 25 S-adenosylmethionine transporter 26